MNGNAFTILNPESFVGIFSDMAAKKSDVQTFLKGKEKPKFRYSVAVVMAFLAAENENQQLQDLPQADFGGVPERFLLSVRIYSITENFVY